MKFLPKSLFGRLFLLIFSFMISMVVLMRILFALFISNQVGQQFANFSQSLSLFAEELNVMGFEDSNNRFAEHLYQSTGLILRWNADQQLDKLPNISVYNAWNETLGQKSNHGITMSYQALPDKIIWLHHHSAPQFSLGIPEVYRKAVTQMLVVYVLIALCFSFLSAYLAALFLNRPLKELAVKASMIGQDIDSIDIKPSGPKEIQAVSLAMNKMRADLDSMVKKQKFLLAGISHDLRTPLTRIHIATKILVPDANGFTEGINADIEEMNGVLHRFIELTRFNIEETELWQVGDIAPLIREVAEKYHRSKTELILSLVPTPPLRYKPMALQRYLYNLINNSIKYGGCNITISTQAIGDEVVLSVSDQGPGFPLSVSELMNYSDLDRDNKAFNGLGLRIVQLIAKLHEAELILRNKSEGGTEVLLTLKTFASVG
jgi:two-component system osmolarity sensor histidine kinase EnvZ